MKIKYKKLKVMMAEYDLQLQDIHNNAGVPWGALTKINKGDLMTLESLIKICGYLSSLSGSIIKIDDIIDYDFNQI